MPVASELAVGVSEEAERSAERSDERPPAAPGLSAEGPAETPPKASSDAAASETVARARRSPATRPSFRSCASRIVREIGYPALARARGWQGTVVLSVRLDSVGRLVQIVVRRSSGYEVLDRAAAALLRKVTPVSNPLFPAGEHRDPDRVRAEVRRRPGRRPSSASRRPRGPTASYMLRSIPTLKENGGMMYPFTVW